DEPQRLEFHLRGAAADGDELDVALGARDVAERLLDAPARPPEVAAHLPAEEKCAIKLSPARLLVLGVGDVAPGEAAGRELELREGPVADAQPSDVERGRAPLRERAVEDGAQALGREEEIARAEIAVDERDLALHGRVRREPAEDRLARRGRIE